MRTFILSLYFVCCLCTANAQTPSVSSQQSFGGSNYEIGMDFKRTSDKGFILLSHASSIDGDVVGIHTTSSLSSKEDVWLIKLDSNRNVQWKKCYGGNAVDYAQKIVQLEDSGYMVMAETYSTDGDLAGVKNTTTHELWVFRITKTGTILWSKIFGDNTGYDLFKDKTDCKILFGNSTNLSGSVAGIIGKIDTSGTFLVLQNYSDVLSTRIRKTQDSNYIVSGQYTHLGRLEASLTKYDSNFTLIWSAITNIQYQKAAYDVLETADSGFLAGGHLFIPVNYTALPGHHGRDDYFLVKYDKNGVEKWHQFYGGTQDEKFEGMLEDYDGGVILYGTALSNDGQVTGHHGSSSGGDIWIVKVDTAGTLLWQRSYGSSSDDYIFMMDKNGGNSYTFFGTATYSNGDAVISHFADAWLVNLTPTTLPLRLISFGVKKVGNTALLTWKTAGELNVSHFNVERSINNKDFSAIKAIAANGRYNYSIKDENLPNVKTVYYRLATIDKDGSSQFSNIQTINLIPQNDFTIVPNPAKEKVTISGNFSKVIISDNLGKILLSKVFDKTQHTATLSIHQLIKGIYYVQCTNGEEALTKKLMVR